MTKEREGEVMMVLLSVIESWFPILSIITIGYVGALFSYSAVLLIALLFFFLMMLRNGRLSELRNRAAYKDLLLTSVSITLLYVLVFMGMRYTTAGNMAVIIFTQLFFSYLYFNLFGHEKLTLIHTFGALLMAVGALGILWPDEVHFNQGDLLILLAAMLSPYANLFQKRARSYCSTETILTVRSILALPVIVLLACCFEPLASLTAWANALPYLAVIGIVIFGFSKILWIEALHRISITKVSALLALVPMLTLLFAYLYLGEVPSVQQLVATLPIILGGLILSRPSRS